MHRLSHFRLHRTRALVTLAVITAFLAVSSAAQATKLYDPQCGSNPSKYASVWLIDHQPGYWDLEWQQVCGTGGTVEYALQHNTGNGTWVDDVNKLYTTPSDYNNTYVVIDKHPTGITCNNNWQWRLHIWDYNTDSVLPLASC